MDLKTLFFPFLFVLLGFSALGQGTQVQIVHNAADTSLSQIDVWIDTTVLASNLGFRKSTNFETVSPGGHAVRIMPKGGTDTANALLTEDVTFVSGQNHLVLQGVYNIGLYSPPVPLELVVLSNARSASSVPGNTDFRFVAGSTDAPAFDIVETQVLNAAVVADWAFGSATPYVEEFSNDFRFRLQESGNNVFFAEYEAPFASLGYESMSLLIVSSGFVDPSQNANGEAFGLFAVLPQAAAFAPLKVSTGEIQIANISDDTALATLDVYIDGSLSINDLAFHHSSTPLKIASGVGHEVHLTPGNAAGIEEAIFDTTLAVAMDSRATFFVGGISGTGTPDGQLFVNYMEESLLQPSASGAVAYRLLHAAVGQGPVDIHEGAFNTFLAEGLYFGDLTTWNEVPAATYIFNVIKNGSDTTVFSMDFQHPAVHGKAVTFIVNGSTDTNSSNPMAIWVCDMDGGAMHRFGPEGEVTGLREVSQNHVNAFPNPTTGGLNVSSNGAYIQEISIYNMIGQQVLRLACQSAYTSISLHTLPSGTYQLHVVMDGKKHIMPVVKQ